VTIVARVTPHRAERGLPIRRPRKKRQQNNDARLLRSCDKYDSGEYTRMQFLRAVSHCVMHAEPLQTQVHDDSGDESDRDDSAADTDADTGNAAPADASSDTSDRCEVCLLQPRAGVALVPCGHSRFCATCADTVASMDSGCPICRSPIRMVLRLYQ